MKKKKNGQTKHVIFRVTEDEFKKTEDLIEQVKEKDAGKILKTFKFDKSKFYRLFFFEGMDAVERKLSNPTLCSKCGKPLAISVPRHLRSRMDVCECGQK
jgi:hypothetical protein